MSGFWIVNVDPTSPDLFNINAEVYDASQNQITSMSVNSGIGTVIPNWASFTEPFGPCLPGVTASTLDIYIDLPVLISYAPTYAQLDDLTLTFATGISDFKNILTKLSVDGNHLDQIEISFSVTRKTGLQFFLYDISGREILISDNKNYTLGNHKLSYDLNLSKGIYILQAVSQYGTETVKFVKE
jgi:hypothetical protein